MAGQDPDRIALRFVNEINRHDLEALAALMAGDFRFIDGLGHEVRGRERAREALGAQIVRFPDYRILVHDHLVLGPTVALFGTVSGTAPVGSELPLAHRWSIPSAWRAVVRDGLLTEWQVYADPEPVRKAVAARSP